MKKWGTILVEVEKGLARVTLNRPDRRNAIDDRMVGELCESFEELGRNPSVRVIVLTGSGSTFCAGADLAWMESDGALAAAVAQKDAERLMSMFRSIDECPSPVIGRVQGSAFGGGVGLIAVCDVVVAAEDITCALSEVRLGLIPAVIAPFLLRKAGESFVRRYCVTGQSFPVSVAHRFNLVHDVVAKAALDGRVGELVDAVMRSAPGATRQTKALFRNIRSLPDTALWAACAQANAQTRLSSEAGEGLQAFLAKRVPFWAEETGTRPEQKR
jgi:methylglutaconyl-CoA hydratase